MYHIALGVKETMQREKLVVTDDGINDLPNESTGITYTCGE